MTFTRECGLIIVYAFARRPALCGADAPRTMILVRNLLRRLPFPTKFRAAKMLFRLARPLAVVAGPLGRLIGQLATPAETAAILAGRPAGEIEILVVLDRLPLPTKDAARVRMLAILKILTGFAGVVLIPLYHRFSDTEFERSIRKMGVEIVGVFDFERFLAGRRFDLALISYPHVADYMLPEVRRHFPAAKVIYDTVDVQFVRLGREAEVTGDPRYGREAENMKATERRLAGEADQTWCVTEDDRGFLQAEAPKAAIRVVPNVHKMHGRGPDFEDRDGLLFIGNFEHRPNADAVRLLLDKILPELGDDLAGVKLHVLGGSMPKDLLGRQSERFAAHGFVADVAPFFTSCRVFVAPLRFGGGMKGKIGEALSYGLPVITTDIGAEGFGLIDGVNALIADDPDDFAANIGRVYHNKAIWQTLADNGLALAAVTLSPEVAERSIRSAFDELLPGRGISAL